MRLEDEQPPEIHKPGDRIMPDKVSDPQTGISVRFIRQYDAAAERRRSLEPARLEADKRLFRMLVETGMAARWHSQMTPAGLRVLKCLRISPE